MTALHGSEVFAGAGGSSIILSMVAGDFASSETGVGGFNGVIAVFPAAALFALLLV